jgi:outer membrane protein assembly factor BamE (lipoprotein component of BamABCDE complex)
MRKYLPSLFLLPVLLLVNCASSNPTGRIEKNPKLYNDLPVSQQEMVSQGQIAEGMSPDAVYLALGSPDRRLDGFSDGIRTMRWDYTTLRPIYHNNFHGGFGYGRGYYDRYYNNFAFGPTVEYVPARSGTVWFENDRVQSWERIRR